MPTGGLKEFQVFSTSVEVFLQDGVHGSRCTGLLHVRGGVSLLVLLRRTNHESSPRPWRCFYLSRRQAPSTSVFSTSVEVFLQRSQKHPLVAQSSPRPWRCFQRLRLQLLCLGVFSTSVEVFLRARKATRLSGSLLHVRGGVSWRLDNGLSVEESSPRTWRCFFIKC